MKCCYCPFYKSGYQYNACALTESEYFREPKDCSLVNEDGTPNTEEIKRAFGEGLEGKA